MAKTQPKNDKMVQIEAMESLDAYLDGEIALEDAADFISSRIALNSHPLLLAGMHEVADHLFVGKVVLDRFQKLVRPKIEAILVRHQRDSQKADSTERSLLDELCKEDMLAFLDKLPSAAVQYGKFRGKVLRLTWPVPGACPMPIQPRQPDSWTRAPALSRERSPPWAATFSRTCRLPGLT